MLEIFNPVRTLFKINYVSIDNKLFFLHSKITSLLFLAFCVIVSTRQFIVHTIDCDFGSTAYYTLNSYCLNRGTFVISRLLSGSYWETVDPGIGPELPGDKRIYFNYYQWVGLSLIIQATIFYVPQLIWKKFEGQQLKRIVTDYQKPMPVAELQIAREVTVQYFMNSWNHQNSYFFDFMLCEILNSLNVIGQFFFIDYCLNGQFVCYGLNYMLYLLFNLPENQNPMIEVFPPRSKCIYYSFGPSGTEEVKDVLCTLTLNIVNKKIYLFIWFWFYFLLIAGLFMVFYQLLTIFSVRIRYYLLHCICKFNQSNEVDMIVRSLRYSDWFFFYQFAKNIKPSLLKHIVTDIAKIFFEKNDAI